MPSQGGTEEWALLQPPIRIGRNGLNNCPIAHVFVSDFHVILEQIEGQLCIRDLHSKNGVYSATGERLAPDISVPLAMPKSTFVLGKAIRVDVEKVEDPSRTGRRSLAADSVFLNREALEAGLRASAPAAVANAVGSRFQPAAAAPAATPYGPAHVSSAPPAVKLAVRAASGRLESQPPGMGTGYLSMPVETLALQGLGELALSLVPGHPFETTGDIARLLRKLHDTVEVFCRCFVPLRDGYAQFISSMDLQRAATRRSLNCSRSAFLLEDARDPASVAAALLDWRNADFDAPSVVAGIFADLMAHQLALVEGVMQGVEALLEELSPENIERRVQEEEGLSAFMGRFRKLWGAFQRRYEELANEAQTFERVFGPEFAASYREYAARQSKVVP